MKNRFAKGKRNSSILRSLILPGACFVAAVLLFNFGITGLGETSEAERLKSAESAIRRGVVQCYAIEGQYPPDVQYLVDHYGLLLDEDTYIIEYRAFAENIMPEVLVLPKDFRKITAQPDPGMGADG